MSNLILQTIVCGAYQANAYLLYRPERPDALLIDPGDDLEALKKAVEQSGKKLTDILLTHGHFDHFLCAAHLQKEYGARLHVHESDAYMLSSAADSALDTAACRAEFLPVTPDAPYEGERLNVCGIEFRVVHTPGHTAGGVCLVCAEDNIMFSGDTVFAAGYGRYDLAGGSLHHLLSSLRKILAMDRSLNVYPGHGESATLAQIARYFGK